MSNIEIANCATTNICLGKTAFFPKANVPFNTLIGLKEDKYNAG